MPLCLIMGILSAYRGIILLFRVLLHLDYIHYTPILTKSQVPFHTFYYNTIFKKIYKTNLLIISMMKPSSVYSNHALTAFYNAKNWRKWPTRCLYHPFPVILNKESILILYSFLRQRQKTIKHFLHRSCQC